MTLDLSSLYRNTIGFDRLATLLERSTLADPHGVYPPYNIEAVADNEYAIVLAVAGYRQEQLTIHVDNGILTVKGGQGVQDNARKFLYRGINTGAFERQFNLAEHVEVKGARLENGQLIIALRRELPQAMKPRRIPINVTVPESAGEHADQAA